MTVVEKNETTHANTTDNSGFKRVYSITITRKLSFASHHVSTRGHPTCTRLVCYSNAGNPAWLTTTRNPIATAHMPRSNNDCSSTIVDTIYPPQMT